MVSYLHAPQNQKSQFCSALDSAKYSWLQEFPGLPFCVFVVLKGFVNFLMLFKKNNNNKKFEEN